MTDAAFACSMPRVFRASVCLAFAIAACSGDDGSAPIDSPAAVTTVYVVRHAETMGTGSDPPLSTAGQMRSETLATKLESANISAIYTSEYRRTHDTAVATSTASSVAIETKTVGNLDSATYGMQLATAIRALPPPQAILIVGHSNTVPQTVMAFTDMMVPAILETEYDRFYTITVAEDGVVVEASTY